MRNGSGILELRELLTTPAVALGLGAFVGLGLFAPVLLGFRFLDAGRVDVGLGLTMGTVFAGMLIALGLLFGYRALAPKGLVYFGPALVGGFVVALGGFAVRAALQLLKTDEHETRS